MCIACHVHHVSWVSRKATKGHRNASVHACVRRKGKRGAEEEEEQDEDDDDEEEEEKRKVEEEKEEEEER